MDAYKKHIELLGLKGKDKITGFKGVIDSVCFDLYGCIQVSLKPPMNKEGIIPDGYWVDVTRVEISGKRIVPLGERFELHLHVHHRHRDTRAMVPAQFLSPIGGTDDPIP